MELLLGCRCRVNSEIPRRVQNDRAVSSRCLRTNFGGEHVVVPDFDGGTDAVVGSIHYFALTVWQSGMNDLRLILAVEEQESLTTSLVGCCRHSTCM